MDRAAALRQILTSLPTFSRALFPDHQLRRYQVQALAPIVRAIEHHGGGSFVLLFCRQSGKDESLCQLFAYLLARYQRRAGSIVFAAPTFGQSDINRRRLIAHLQSERARAILPQAHSTSGFRVVSGAAQIVYRSAQKEANARGETASRLLVGNEAQDIEPATWDARFAPMTASTDAPTVYAGTPWDSSSLLAREIADADGRGRVYRVDWRQVADELPAYGRHVRERIAKLGPGHPFIRTEYELESLDSEGGLFPDARQAHMRGYHPRRFEAEPGHQYAMLLDVGGGAEDQAPDAASRSRERKPDSTALTVVDVDLATVADDLIARPTYRVVDRREWIGVPHPTLYGELRDLALVVWRARWLIVDATGIGSGLAAFLGRALSGRGCKVIPFLFSLASKSKLGWAFVGCIESGRYKEYADDDAPDTRRYWHQVKATRYSVQPGPGQILKWAVPETAGHDDLIVSAALCGELDEQDWRPRTASGHKR